VLKQNLNVCNVYVCVCINADQVVLLSQCPTAAVNMKTVSMRSERVSVDLQSLRYQTDAGQVEQGLR